MPWLDHDHFLPSAIQRYHQLFLPALQLIDAILATLGPGHLFAVNQVKDYFFF
jgi:nuclear pore complex protein Nup205